MTEEEGVTIPDRTRRFLSARNARRREQPLDEARDLRHRLARRDFDTRWAETATQPSAVHDALGGLLSRS